MQALRVVSLRCPLLIELVELTKDNAKQTHILGTLVKSSNLSLTVSMHVE